MGVGPMLAALGFRQFIQVGHLTMIDADGRRHEFQGLPGPRAVIRLADRSLHRRLFFSPQMAVGEGYMDGGLVMEDGTDLAGFLVTAPMREEYTPDLVELGVVAASASPLPPPPPPPLRKASTLSP